MRPALARGLLAAAAACALAACGSSDEPRRPAGSASPAVRADASPAEPAPAPDAAEPPRSAGDFPAACNEYRELVDKLARCGDALPPSTATNLRSHFERQWAAWAKLPERERAELATICKRSSEVVQQAAAAGCGW